MFFLFEFRFKVIEKERENEQFFRIYFTRNVHQNETTKIRSVIRAYIVQDYMLYHWIVCNILFKQYSFKLVTNMRPFMSHTRDTSV